MCMSIPPETFFKKWLGDVYLSNLGTYRRCPSVGLEPAAKKQSHASATRSHKLVVSYVSFGEIYL